MMFRTIARCGCAMSLFFAVTAFALDLPKGITAGPSVGGISEYRFENGLKVLLFPDDSSAKLTVNITYLVGSRNENYGETGQAHLLEHMLFKGSPKVPDVNAEFAKRGASPNAITRTDITNYFEVMPASEDNLKFAIMLEADRMVNSYLRKEDLDKEFTVVRNEFERGENEPGQVVLKRLFAVAYDWHNYGKLPIGNRADIENVDLDRLHTFYKTHYQPDNAVLLIAGKFDPTLALITIKNEFGVIPKPLRKLQKINTIEPAQDGERNVVVRRKGEIQLMMAAYKGPGGLHPDSLPLAYASMILGHVPSGRLHKKLVETQQAVGVGAQTLPYGDPSPVILIAAQKAGENVDALRDKLITEIESFAKTAPSEEEMQRTRTLLDNSFESVLTQPERIGLSLSTYIGLGDWRLFFYGRDELAKVKPADVQRVAAKYLIRDNRTLSTFLPENEPKRADITAAPLAAELLAAWKPDVKISQGEAFEASAKNIDARTRFTQIGGINIAMLPKKTRNESVQVRINFKWGDETSLTGRADALGLAGGTRMLGTTKFTRAALADELQKRKLRGGITGFETTRSDIVSAIELAAHVLREPNFPDTELEQIRKSALTSIELSKSDPGALAQDRMRAHFNAYPTGHPNYQSSTAEGEVFIKRFTRTELVAAHNDFVGASQGEIVIVGDFDVDTVTATLQKAFANWKSKASYARVAAKLASPAAMNEWIDTPDKENAVIQMRTAFAMKRDDPDYPALWVANEIMGGSGLDSRITGRIRGKEGLSYGINSNFAVGVWDAVASWGVGGTAAPQSLTIVERAVLEEINKARDSGFTAEEVVKVQKLIRANYDSNYASDATVAGMWMDRLDRDLKFADYEAFITKVQAVTPTQAQAAFRKYIDPAKLSVVKAGDKKKAQ
jgi:zinc protease